jgi:hypothetical protein
MSVAAMVMMVSVKMGLYNGEEELQGALGAGRRRGEGEG